MVKSYSFIFKGKVVDGIFDMGQVLKGVEEECPSGETAGAGLEMVRVSFIVLFFQVKVLVFEEVHLK